MLIVLVALEDSDTPSNLIAKAVNAKDPRMAAADAVRAALGVEPADGKQKHHPHFDHFLWY